MLARVATFAQAPAPADAPAVNGLRDLVRDFDAVPEPIAGTCPCLDGWRGAWSRRARRSVSGRPWSACTASIEHRASSIEHRASSACISCWVRASVPTGDRPTARRSLEQCLRVQLANDLAATQRRGEAAETRDTAVATLEQPVSRAAHHASRSGKRKASLATAATERSPSWAARKRPRPHGSPSPANRHLDRAQAEEQSSSGSIRTENRKD